MKTTFIVKDELYKMLVEEAKREYGSTRKLSELLNKILMRFFARKKDLFGTTKRFSLVGIREEHGRFD